MGMRAVGAARAIAAAVVTSALAIAGSSSAHAAGHLLVIAHNGGTEAAPENTLAAFRHDIAVGVDGIEFGVRLSGDGLPVVIHDETLTRTTNCSGFVDARPRWDLVHCDAGSWFGPEFELERIPTLDQALDVMADSSVVLYVHIKEDSLDLAQQTVRAIEAHGLAKRTIYLGTTESVLDTIRRAGGAPLCWVYSNPAGWDSDYPYLMPYAVPVSAEQVARARGRGQIVLPVENHPTPLADLPALGANGIVVSDVDGALDLSRHTTHPHPEGPGF